jgi:solute carrier family 8 (sodium/calcium exchanger)
MVYHANRLETTGKTRADYRKEGVQAMTGKTKKQAGAALMQDEAAKAATSGTQVGFECTQYSCKESVYSLEVAVVRIGDVSRKMKISYTTREDMSAPEKNRAKEGEDYHKASGELHFAKGESRKTFEVKMIDDDVVEEDETFLLELSNCSDASSTLVEERRTSSVTIISDDDPGILVLAKVPDEAAGGYLEYYTANAAAGTVAVLVRREGGSSGDVGVQWRTIASTAKPGLDYGRKTGAGTAGAELSGSLEFKSSFSEQHIIIPVLRSDGPGGDFTVELYNPQGGASIGKAEETIRGASGTITVRVRNDPEAEQLAKDIARLLDEHYDEIRTGASAGSWGDQFKDAVTPDDDLGGAVGTALFYINMPWRLVFACIPPPSMANGWLCFLVALGGIACVTVVVGDLAALLGCSLGLEDSITAITFVALGTSLPDTFASKAATLGDDSADAAIGNVTGSNSVNVFLGLGLPWLIAAIYWDGEGPTPEWKGTIGLKNPEIVAANPGGGFVVPAGSLGFSVTVFCSCAVMCIATLFFRRRVFGAELGARESGSIHHTVTSVFFAALWLFYVIMSVAQTWGWASESVLYKVVIAVVLLFVVVMAGLFASLNGKYDTSNEFLGVAFGEDGEDIDDAGAAAAGAAGAGGGAKEVVNPMAESSSSNAAAAAAAGNGGGGGGGNGGGGGGAGGAGALDDEDDEEEEYEET